jgi:hypothetical protein
MKPSSDLADHGTWPGLARRDFLKLGAGFSVALSVAGVLGTLGGCSDGAKVPATGFTFLQASDVALFSALAPAVVDELAKLDAAERKARTDELLGKLDTTCSALGMASKAELRKLLDLLAMAPVRYVLTGVGAWNDASIETLQAFMLRWRSSRFETLTAGGNVLVRLTASSYYVLPVSWPATGYPGPLAHVFAAINS